MKYYAVTEDPRELYHYGVKGMKWGQHIFGDKPKSPGYHKALSKLKTLTNKGSKAMKVAKSNIQKSATQIAYNRRAAQDRKYEKAVQKSQRQTLAVANLSNFIGNENNRNQLNREISAQRKADALQLKRSNLEQRNTIREERKAIKAEKKFSKYMQEAREGSLRYGRLSDDQIQRVQDRLALEANTRRLGGTEKPSWRQQKKEARRAGYLQGITKGTSAAMEEVGRAAATYGIQHIVDRRKLNARAKQEGKQNKLRSREQNSKSHRDIANEVKQEAFEARVREGQGIFQRNNLFQQTAGKQAKELQRIESRAKETKRIQAANEKRAIERDENLHAYLEENGYGSEKEAMPHVLALTPGGRKKVQESHRRAMIEAGKKIRENKELEKRERDFLIEEDHKSRQNARQQIENDARDKAKLDRAAEQAALYGFVQPGLLEKGGGDKSTIQALADYYKYNNSGKYKPIEEAEQRARAAEERARNAEKTAEQRIKQKQKQEAEEKVKKEREQKFNDAAEASEYVYSDFRAPYIRRKNPSAFSRKPFSETDFYAGPNGISKKNHGGKK